MTYRKLPDPQAGSATQAEATPSPAPTEGGSAGSESATPNPEDSAPIGVPAERPPLWPLLISLLVAAIPLTALIWRKALQEKRTRSFLQKDTNAAVLAICRYALKMLRFSGAPPMQPLESPEYYAYSVSRLLPAVDRERLESALLSAQRASFSGRMCSRKERDEAIQFVRSLSGALFARLSRIRRLLFRWRFPLL